MPGVLNHLAAKLAWDGLFYDGAADPDAPNNLHEPVPGHQSAGMGISTAALVRTAGSYSSVCRRAQLRQGVLNMFGAAVRMLASCPTPASARSRGNGEMNGRCVCADR
jgi:hypothetical protein